MPDAVILSQDTYDRIMKVVEGWEEGELPIILGDGLKLDEQGPTGMKFSVDVANASNAAFPTLTANVCINGSPVSKNFLIKL